MTFVFRRNNVFARWVLGGIYVRVRGWFKVRGGISCEVRVRGGFRVRSRGRVGLGLEISQETTPLATSHADKVELGKHKILF